MREVERHDCDQGGQVERQVEAQDNILEWAPEDFLDPAHAAGEGPSGVEGGRRSGAGVDSAGSTLPCVRPHRPMPYLPCAQIAPLILLAPVRPQRKPITELKGNVCVTHNFDGLATDNVRPGGGQWGLRAGKRDRRGGSRRAGRPARRR